MRSLTSRFETQKQLRRIHHRLVEAGITLEDADTEEIAELNQYAMIRNTGATATTRIENEVLTDTRSGVAPHPDGPR